MDIPKCGDINAISSSFRLKWTLSKEDFETLVAAKKGVVSKSYKLKNFPGLEFQIKLEFGSDNRGFRSFYHFFVTGTISRSTLIEYVFIIENQRVLRFEKQTDYVFSYVRPTLKEILRNVDQVTIYCKISVYADVREVKKTPPSNTDEYEIFAASHLQCISSRLSIESNFEEVSKYVYSGQIPNFTVPFAIELLKVRDRNVIEASDAINELKALSVEYLMENLTCDNFVCILKVAVDECIAVLQKKCVEYASKNCKILPAK